MVSHFSYSAGGGLRQQAAYTHTYPADQQMTCEGSNRLRSESGSSTESSKGSGGSNGSSKSRRRSHRPRGCRGGSNRRKHLQHMGSGRSSHSGSRMKSGFKPLYPPGYGVNFPAVDYANPVAAMSNRSGVEDQFAHHRQVHHHTSGQSHLSTTSGHISVHRNVYNGGGSYYGVDFSLQQPYYDVPNTYPHQYASVRDSTNDVKTIQRSYSDTSSASDFASEVQSESHEESPFLFPIATVAHSSTTDLLLSRATLKDNQILPPLPSGAFVKHQPIPTGPNPYALKHSTVNTSTASATTTIVMGLLPPPGILKSCHNSLTLPTVGAHDSVNDGTDKILDTKDYRADRIEKQRQTVEGGSLFVTSPRSFLMGMRTTTTNPSDHSATLA